MLSLQEPRNTRPVWTCSEFLYHARAVDGGNRGTCPCIADPNAKFPLPAHFAFHQNGHPLPIPNIAAPFVEIIVVQLRRWQSA